MKNNKYWELNGVEYIRRMYEDTKDGQMTITHYPTNGEQVFDLRYGMSWNEADMEEAIKQYNSLTAILTALGELHAASYNQEIDINSLSAEELAVWETYVKPLEPFEEAKEYIIEELKFRGEFDQLEEEEYDLLERHYEWQEKQYLQRLAKKCDSPRMLIENAQMYEKAVKENAGSAYMNYIGRWLAEAIVLYNYHDEAKDPKFSREP